LETGGRNMQGAGNKPIRKLGTALTGSRAVKYAQRRAEFAEPGRQIAGHRSRIETVFHD
jgi:hypothetical protein